MGAKRSKHAQYITGWTDPRNLGAADYYKQKLAEYRAQENYSELARQFDVLGRMEEDDMTIGPGAWLHTTGTTGGSTFTGASYSPEEARIAKFWIREYSPEQRMYVERINYEAIHEYLTHMGMNDDPDYERTRRAPESFDMIFGKGAHKQYLNHGKRRAVLKKTKAEMKKIFGPRLKLWGLPEFIVPKEKTVAQTLEKQHSDSMAENSEMFHVRHNESLIDALQRTFDEWAPVSAAA